MKDFISLQTTEDQQSGGLAPCLQELAKAVAFADLVEAGGGGVGVTSIGATLFARKWLLDSARKVVTRHRSMG